MEGERTAQSETLTFDAVQRNSSQQARRKTTGSSTQQHPPTQSHRKESKWIKKHESIKTSAGQQYLEQLSNFSHH